MTNGEHDLRHGQNPEENATEILARENLLLSLGFSQDWINKLKVDNPTLCSEEIINSKIQGLTKRGFSNPKKMIESSPAILSYAFENIDRKLAGLTERGFSNPKKMIESLPAILGLAFENIDRKLAGLTERGFSNPKKMIESLPAILGLAFENIDRKLAGLTERGFSNPKKMIESLPAILGLAFENIDGKLAGLTERGFSNPKKMIESSPTILGLAFENIDRKLAGLTERGFSNPKKMIESLPAILGLAFENIDRKLKMLEKIIKLYDLTLSAPELMEQIPFLFSSKIDKLWTIARICKKYLTQPSDIDAKLIQKMLSFNLEDVMLALQTTPSPTNMDELTEKVKQNKKQKIPKPEKKKQIHENATATDPKIYHRYQRGYPMANKDSEIATPLRGSQ